MLIEISLSAVPPAVTLREPDDFTAFKLVVRHGEHSWIAPEQLIALAGDRGNDPAWREQLDGMLGYARTKGWIGEDGAIRAHVEVAP